MKRCTKCGEEKPLADFSVRKACGKPLSRCKACQALSAREWAARNPERTAAKLEAWCAANADRRKEIAREWARRNAGAVLAQTMKRRAGKKHATPAWADLNAIKQVYARAKRIAEVTGEAVHVDHIYPLRGKTVSGLHVHNNLRVVLKEENLRKGNKLIEEA